MTNILQSDKLIPLLNALETLFSLEKTAGGDEAAQALHDTINNAVNAPETLPPRQHILTDMIREALTDTPHPLAHHAHEALPLLSFHYSGLSDGRIREDIARQMATCELIGPHGMIHHDTVRVGLFAQSAGLDYVTRTHAAEETFIMLGGEGHWTCNGAEATRQTSGAIIHHPSNAPHASITKSRPLIAAWRWTGDIAYETYALHD